MPFFPEVDPIPLPAPVWLFKALHVVTLTLHFGAVELLLGGLFLATLWNACGCLGGDTPSRALHLNASSLVVRRLPLVMVFVINLGVPPLLFSQVLYGRALYTSSILIGALWIAVIPLLMAAYFLLYLMAKRAEGPGGYWGWGLLTLLLTVSVAGIYSTNMTLMLRPEVWGALYAANPHGFILPRGDPTVTPRWLFMLASAGLAAGVGVGLLALKPSLDDGLRQDLRRRGGWAAFLFALAVAGASWRVAATQPPQVLQALLALPLYRAALWMWGAASAAAGLTGLASALRPRTVPALSVGAAALAFAALFGMTLFRDGLRDVTLQQHGFDVWNRAVAANWTVVGLFLGLFVVGVATVGWMGWVVARARPVNEKVA